nr:sigma-E processing peptidase SpoIIGA [Paenibacillus larvae]
MIVYMDLIFLVNFLLDGAILVGTARTRKLPVVWWRLLFLKGLAHVMFCCCSYRHYRFCLPF